MHAGWGGASVVFLFPESYKASAVHNTSTGVFVFAISRRGHLSIYAILWAVVLLRAYICTWIYEKAVAERCWSRWLVLIFR